MSDRLKVWVIGAGAIAEQYHLPVVGAMPELELVGIVDLDEQRLDKVARKFNIELQLQDYRRVPLDRCDWVLICVPPFYQASIASYFLERGISVLIEKPGAISKEEYWNLLDQSREHGSVLRIGLFRRLYPVTNFLRRATETGVFGKLKRVSFEEGYFYDWQNESAYIFDRKLSGGGVLLDTGSHTLDRVFYVTQASAFSDLLYEDNEKGGVESECQLSLTLKCVCQQEPVMVQGKLSRLRQLRNEFVFHYDKAVLRCATNDPHAMTLEWISEQNNTVGKPETEQLHVGTPTSVDVYFSQQIIDMMQRVLMKDVAKIDADCIELNFELFDACYANRGVLRSDWQSIPPALLAL